jgi:guanylate cyclase
MLKIPSSIKSRLLSLVASPADDEETILRKTLLVFSSTMMATSGILWGSIYLFYGEVISGSIPLAYALLSYLSLGIYLATHLYDFFRTSQLIFSLVLPFLLMISLGGFVPSSAVVLWSVTCPLGALVFAGRRQAFGWMAAFVCVILSGAFLEPYLQPSNELPGHVRTLFFVLNICGPSCVAFVLVQYFVIRKEEAFDLLHIEQAKSERLLLNILPADVAAVLKNEGVVQPVSYGEVSILFADIENFTSMSARIGSGELVGLLNEVFSYCDELAGKYGLEKIKTIGDCYMVAAGIPKPRTDHAQVLARMALDMQQYFSSTEIRGRKLTFRIGIHSGPVVAGVIGHRKFAFDLWGDTVNTASRMESHGTGGSIQVSRSTYDLIKDRFLCEARGTLKVKGKGEMEVWHVQGMLDPDGR